LRNYISVWIIRWIQHVYSGGVEIYFGPATAAGKDRDDLYVQVQAQDVFMMNSLGGDGFGDEFPNEPQQAYVCFDKETVMRMLQNVDRSGTSVAVYLWDALSVEPSQQIIRNVLKTPRYDGWTDSAGVKRAPTPSDSKKKQDFSGAAGLILFLQYLQRVCGTPVRGLQANRRRQEACFLAGEVNANRMTITDAIVAWGAFNA
jgi:hypothetical protein